MVISLIVAGLALGSIYALLGLSLVLVNKATDVVNFAQGEIGMIGAFTGMTVLAASGWPLPLVFVVGMLSGALLGLFLERVVIRPLGAAPHLNLLIVTVGLWFIFNSVAGLIWGYDPYRFPSLLPAEPLDILGAKVPPSSLGIVAVACVAMALLYLFFEHTRDGIAMRAASNNPRAARLMGIRVERVAAISWAVACGLSVTSSMLIAPVTFLDQQMMVPVILKAFAGAILGGFTSLPGTVVGCVLLGLAETFVGAYLSAALKDALAFTLIILVLMVKPAGLFGRSIRKKV